jgi:hypothetical protein
VDLDPDREVNVAVGKELNAVFHLLDRSGSQYVLYAYLFLPFEYGKVSYLDEDGNEAVASGSNAEIARQLILAGYKI